MIKNILGAAFTAAFFASAADAATLNGTFTIDIYQTTNATTAESRAEKSNIGPGNFLDTITYEGDLDFGTFDGSDATTIAGWLATGGGSVIGLDAIVGALQLSKPSIGSGTATATFFDIYGLFASGFDSIVRHDDGVSVFDGGTVIAASAAPTTVKNTAANGFDGGTWNLLYVATNGDPSVLRVTGEDLPTTVIPVPAGLPLLLTALGGFALFRRRA